MAVIVGAGASRGVSYAQNVDIYSPLDSDFFDLLQRIRPSRKDLDAVDHVLREVRGLPKECWGSFERAFYTLHLRAVMENKLDENARDEGQIAEVVERFTRSFQAVLREAHGIRVCMNHKILFTALHERDTVVSFNYDLVADRALADLAADRHISYGRWIYGLSPPALNPDLPILLKLHGSSNWDINDMGEIDVPTDWTDLDESPGYTASKVGFDDATRYPIILPFWEKPIERDPWLGLWKQARRHLGDSEDLIVWGYSLPSTDIKAHHLFSLSLAWRERAIRLCVIDPSAETKRRWRELLPDAQFWPFSSMEDFRNHPPDWWRKRVEPG